ncbi:hypothetical protein [Campylobacter lari]|uniref:hypothetical protein n=1 Tax=Campylobacter lari TaxID=201 RepID=UPI000873F19A|nr:hypothetical protein [Campylobacter lari]MCW0224539.1 hypothetical protein [Campylobacter lari]OEV68552.1 hypothetical protein AJY52_07575 [Campylobacter lari]OEV69687.1 hypothetical protein AJY62_06220 [Campylobacter lari]OEV95254.1 hypothetical protein AJM73_01280 [Campylobacter lari]
MIGVLSDFLKFLGLENSHTQNVKKIEKEENILKNTEEELINDENIKFYEEVEIIQEGFITKEVTKKIEIIEKNGIKHKKEKIEEVCIKKI